MPLHAETNVRHWQALFAIDESSGNRESLQSTTESDIYVVCLGSFTDINRRSFGLICYIRMENLFVRGTRCNDRSCGSIVATACCNLVASGGKTEYAVNSAVVSLDSFRGKKETRRGARRLLLETVGPVDINLLLNHRTSISISYSSGDHAAANESEVDAFNVFIFAQKYCLAGPLIFRISRHKSRR